MRDHYEPEPNDSAQRPRLYKSMGQYSKNEHFERYGSANSHLQVKCELESRPPKSIWQHVAIGYLARLLC